MEFEYYLTGKLGWRSVDELRAGMSQAEFLSWSVYYAREAQKRQLANG